MVSDWFQTTLKLEGSETTCFSIHGHPEPFSDGFRGISEWFQRGLKLCGFRGLSEGSETVWFQRSLRGVVSEEFERGLKPCGFREVSEGSESVCGFRGFRVV